MTREEYRAYLQTPAWRALRAAVLRRCGYRCEDCVAEKKVGRFTIVGRAVHVHHLTYERVGAELLPDLIGVCRRHHEIRHGLNERENRAIAALRRQMDSAPEWEPDTTEDAPCLAAQFGVTAREST